MIPVKGDRWRWKLTENRVFSVKSTCDKLIGLMLAKDRWHKDEKRVFGSIWKSPASLKV